MWTTALTSIGPSRYFAGTRRRSPTIAPAIAVATSQSSPYQGVSRIETPNGGRAPRRTPSSHCTMKGSVMTMRRMRAEWMSAIVRALPPRSSPRSTISTSPPGMPEK